MTRGMDAVDVYADLDWLDGPKRMGVMRRQSGHDVFSFEYDSAWLGTSDVFAFDPDLSLVSGLQYPPSDRTNFGVFLDSAPDRWGRVLMQRREHARARNEKRRVRALTEWDYLLGVHDETRMGALRFRVGDRPFLDADDVLAAPLLTSLRELQAASLKFEEQTESGKQADDACAAAR